LSALNGITVAVLAGGLGTRVAARLGDTPKILAPVRGRTFLDRLLAHLAGLGAGRVVLCLGHLAGRVTDHLARVPPPLPVEWVVEARPLGTAGALALARPLLAGDPVLVLNGDTWIEADFAAFAAAHGTAQATLLCVEVDDIGRYGAVELDPAGRVIRFREKGGRGRGLINAGACLLSQALLGRMPSSGSLERDVLEQLPFGALTGHVARHATFIDIGTPETLDSAGDVIAGAG
jgi:mannose-1-phosphate guanylyltransferase